MQKPTPIQLRSGPNGRARQAGAIDMVDLVLGGVLLILVPFIVIAVAALFSKDSGQARPSEVSNKPIASIPEDAEEIEIRWQLAEKAYRSNAKPILKRVEEAQDSVQKERLRVWGVKALKLADLDLSLLKSTIEKPELASKFSAYHSRIQSLQQEIQTDLARLKELDILGRSE